jgi:hypothetical protein
MHLQISTLLVLKVLFNPHVFIVSVGERAVLLQFSYIRSNNIVA